MLLTLSNELLLEVANYLEWDSDINAFMQVSGRTYYLLSQRLFWHNVFWSESTAFEWALYRGYASVVEKALDAGAWTNIDYKPFSGPLEVAIHYGYADVVKVLLERGVDIDENPRWMISSASGILEIGDKSPLYKALARGHPDVLQVVFWFVKKSQGYDVGKRARPVRGGWHAYGITVTKAAAIKLMRDSAARGDLDSVKFLAQYLPRSINSVVEETSGTAPIIQAVKNHRIEVLRFLLKAGVDPGRDIMLREDTPLYHAAQNGSVEAVQLLLDEGARPDPRMNYQQGGRGHSLEILEMAVTNGHVKVAEVLLKSIRIGPKSRSTLSDKDTLIIAAAACGLTDLVQEILDNVHKGYQKVGKGQRTFLGDNSRPQPLAVAIQNGHKDVVSLLMDYGADMKNIASTQSLISTSPLIKAVSNGRTEVVKFLLDKGVEDLSEANTYVLPIRYLNSSRQCTLGFAALCHALPSPPIFQILLDNGAQPATRAEKLILVTEVMSSGSEKMAKILAKEAISLDVSERDSAAGEKKREELDEQQGEQLGQGAAKPIAETTAEQRNKGLGVKAGGKASKKRRSLIQQIGPNSQEVKDIMSKALVSGDAHMVNYLCSQGCSPNHKWPRHLDGKVTSLEVAALAPYYEVAATTLDILLHYGADINQLQGDWGMGYSDEQYLTALKLLVQRGADAAPHTSKWGQKVLKLAARTRLRRTTRFLLSESCNRGASFAVVQGLIKSCEEHLKWGCDLKFEKVLTDTYWRSIYPVPREKKTT